MLILAGLGNPGPKYAGNRHNVGFMAMDAFAAHWRFSPWRARFQSACAEGEIAGARVLLLKPQTYYNESGRAIGEAMRFFKLAPADVIVFHDEIDLAEGRFRMKTGGGAAGNNGIRSTTAQIGEDFRRARIGTGHPGEKALVHGYVLSDFHKADQVWLEPLLKALAEMAALLTAGEDQKYQTEVLRIAPAIKADPRAASRGD